MFERSWAATGWGLILLCFIGCDSTPGNKEFFANAQDTASRQTSAYVTSEQKAEAFAIIKKLQAMDNYIPFDYSADGCYARALYMAMELAAEGIPSSSVYLEALDGKLNPRPGLYWDYHVAPLLIEKTSTLAEEQIVLDPSLFEQPVELAVWKESCHPQGESEIFISPGSQLGNYFDQQEMPDLIINSFAELPPFNSGQVNYCQRHLCFFLNQQQKQCDFLNERTQYLIEKLTAQNKYFEDPYPVAIGRAL